jgi:hypothetical protein
MKVISYLTAFVVAMAGVADAVHFKLTFRRYNDDACQDSMEKKHHLIHGNGVEVEEDKCQSWNKDQPFYQYVCPQRLCNILSELWLIPPFQISSYSFNFRPHAGELRSEAKSCELAVYPEKGCHGDPVSTIGEVSQLCYYPDSPQTAH